jgi:hypothetical protein
MTKIIKQVPFYKIGVKACKKIVKNFEVTRMIFPLWPVFSTQTLPL